MKPSPDRHQSVAIRHFSRLPDRASIFSTKIFGGLMEKPWLPGRWFSHSKRSGGRDVLRCEQLVNKANKLNAAEVVTLSSPKARRNSLQNEARIPVPRHAMMESAVAKQVANLATGQLG